MTIPHFDQHGLLPVGVHDCTWEEIRSAMCWNETRLAIFQKTQQFFEQEWKPLQIQASVWVDGSFTRKKEHPEDIDVVADISDLSTEAAMPAFVLWFKQASIKAQYAVDFWLKHPILPNDLTHFFQYTGLKAGAELGLDSKQPKGILRVT
jgi:hypothetical protein